MTIIHAVYENGVFRPTEPVNLPPASKVRLEIHPVAETPKTAHLDETYEILARSYDTGIPDLAARHNEHQP